MNKLLLACLLVLAPVSLASADLKIAVIDLGKAFDGYYKTKDAQNKLKVKQDTYQKQVQDLVTDYQHMGEEAQALDKAANDPTLSATARSDKAKALDAKKQDLINLGNKIQEMKTEKTNEIKEELLRRHKDIVDEITKVVTDYSGPQGFDIVIDKSSQSAASGVPIVLYNSSKLTDITSEILTLLNKSAPAPGGSGRFDQYFRCVHLHTLTANDRARWPSPLVTVHTVRSLAELVGGTIEGDGADRVVTGINDLRAAQPDQVSFLGNSKYEPLAVASRAAVILVSPKDSPRFSFTRIVVDSPSAAFGKISALFAPPPVRDEPGIHPTAVIAADAVIGEGVSIQPHVVIAAGARVGARCVIGANCFVGQESIIGDDSRLYPLVTVRERTVIGARVIIHSGAVLGADGFGYDFDAKAGRHVKIPHTGYVQIDDDAEIGANTTIDRGRFGKTHIGQGAKIDNLVQIAHNVVVGAHSIVVSQTGISGSTTLGSYVTLAGQVGLAGHLNIGDRATIAAQSGLNKDVPAGAVLAGHHAIPIRESLKLEALTRRLPELVERLKTLEEKVRSL